MTVIVAVPSLTALTLAIVLSFASGVISTTPLGSLLHVTSLLLALSGSIVAVRVSLSPTARLKLLLSSVTSVTGLTDDAWMVRVNSLLSEP